MATTGAGTQKTLMSATMTFRGWQVGDRKQVAPLIKRYIEEACPDLVPDEGNANFYFDAAGPMSLLAVTKGGQVVGFTLLTPINGVRTKVRMLHSVGTYVLPDYRSRGIGEQLRVMAI